MASSAWQTAMFGPTLTTKDGDVATASNTSLLGADVVGVYFSAHWCPPCRQFTPVLAQIHKDCQAAGKKFQVVFVSSDRDAGSAAEYYGGMPWQMLPFSDRERKGKLSDKFNVQGIPSLVLLDGKSGETMTTAGRTPVQSYGALGFPWNEEAIAKAKAEKAAAKAKALVELPGLLANNSTAGAAALKSGADHVLFWFGKQGCRGSGMVLPKLGGIAKELAGKLAVLHVPFADDAGADAFSAANAAAGLPCITKAELGASDGALNKALKVIFEAESPAVGLTNGTATELVHADCVQQLWNRGAKGYPWTSERMAALQAEEDAAKEKIKAQMNGSAGNLSFLGENLQTKSGTNATAAALGGATVVGVYFSAHWCPPCRGFTPVLAAKYKEIKAAGHPFEVVFLSSDRDEGSFDGYYAEMPWLAMPYAQRDLKEMISGAVGVNGIPTLALFDGKSGKLLTTNGRELIEKPFPFGLNLS